MPGQAPLTDHRISEIGQTPRKEARLARRKQNPRGYFRFATGERLCHFSKPGCPSCPGGFVLRIQTVHRSSMICFQDEGELVIPAIRGRRQGIKNGPNEAPVGVCSGSATQDPV